MFLINSRSHLVSAALFSSACKTLHQKGRTFSRSYGTILPSSFTRVLSCALVFSTCPPVSVCGTVLYKLELRGFSWKRGINDFTAHRSVSTTSHLSVNKKPDLPSLSTCVHVPGLPSPGSPSLLRPPFALIKSPGILTWFPSTTLFSLALGADSPCSD